MLGKLLKYDLKYGYRSFLGMGAAVLLLSLLVTLTRNISLPTDIENVLFVLLPIVLSGVVVASMIIVFQSFGKNLFGSEGYLMFTLPASRGALLISKCISAMIWFVFMIIVGILAVFILTGGIIFDILFAVMGMGLFWYYMLVGLLGVLALILSIYLIITLANVSVGNRRLGTLWSLILSFVYFGLQSTLFDKVLNPLVGKLWVFSYTVNPRDLVTQLLPADLLSSADLTDIPAEIYTVPVNLYDLLSVVIMVAMTFALVRYLIKRRISLA